MAHLYTEIADTDAKRELGFMHRHALGKNEGLLFVFPSSRRLSFWMKDTYVPLDIAFANKNRVITEIKELIPLSMRSVRSAHFAKYALEAPSGWFEQNGVKVGGTLRTAQEMEMPPMMSQMPDQAPPGQVEPPNPVDVAAYDAIMNNGILSMISEANRLKLAIVFTYEFPEGKQTTYELVPLERYETRNGADGRKLLLLGRCATRNGDFRNFDIDKILQYEVYFTEGEHAGKRVVMPMPQVNPQVPVQEPMVASSAAEIKTSIGEVIGIVKESAASGGGSSGQLMMTEYWDSLKKSREHGLSEGQAVLKYLEDNSHKNRAKPSKGEKRRKKPNKK